MSDYISPRPTLPFVFLDGSYLKPKFGPLHFNFKTVLPRDLSAAIQVMQIESAPYKDVAYTYVKNCPTYVVGYTDTGVQIIRGRCEYGGIRDLTASIDGSFKTYSTKDLEALVIGLVPTDLPAYIGTDTPRDLAGIIGVRQSKVPRDLPSSVHGWVERYLAAIIGEIETPRDLEAFIKVTSHGRSDLPASIHSWHTRYLQATTVAKLKYDLNGIISPIPAGELRAYLKVWPQNDLSSYLRSWGAKNLSAFINQVYTKNLPANVHAVKDSKQDIWAKIKGIGKGHLDLGVVTHIYHERFLSALVKAKYFNNFPAYVFPVLPKYIKASLRGWAVSFLSAQISPSVWPWDLTASINCSGGFKNLITNISPVQGSTIYRDLTAQTKSWVVEYLGASIGVEPAQVLWAYINCICGSLDLHASITPKVIRLTTVVDVITKVSKDISATINYLCFGTNSYDLSAYICSKYKEDLGAYIRGITSPVGQNFPAKIGYSCSYTEVDKLKLSINIYSSGYRVEDKIPLLFNTITAGSLLGAYIFGVRQNRNLPASIVGKKVSVYVYDRPIQNREYVLHTKYNGIFTSFKEVELAFKDIVRDYYYSDEGDYAWKSDRTEKWVLDVKSYLPTNVSLNIKRRLHKATMLYDLRKFNSVDEAMRWAIDYVTGQPLEDLQASLECRGEFRGLTSTITPRTPTSQKDTMSASIVGQTTAVADNLFFSVEGNIIKI